MNPAPGYTSRLGAEGGWDLLFQRKFFSKRTWEGTEVDSVALVHHFNENF